MSNKSSKDKRSKKGGSQNRSSSQKSPTEYKVEEMFRSVDDIKNQMTGQHSGNVSQVPVHDSKAATRDKQNTGARRDEGKNKKCDSQQSKRGHSDHQHPRGANYEEHDDNSRVTKNKEKKSSAESKRKVQGGQDKMQSTCMKCSAHFNISNMPMLLGCNHTICATCIGSFKISGETRCPCCKKEINYKFVENYPLLEHIQERARKESDEGHHHSSSHVKQRGRSRTPSEETAMDCSPSSPGKEFHDGKCIEFRKIPTAHCATCQQWACDTCSEREHQRRECCLVPKKLALQEMKDAQVIEADDAVEGVLNALVKLQSYNAHLNALVSAMKVTNEYIKKEKKHVELMIEEGTNRKSDIEAALHEMQHITSLPEALAALQCIEEISGRSAKWTSAVDLESKIYLDENIAKAVKEISVFTLKMMKNEARENQTDMTISALHNIADQTLHSLVQLDEDRLIVPCLDKRQAVPHGTRTIPLLSLKASMDPSSSFAYLDIGIDKEGILGRVVIQVMSETTRGRQFLMMCTGEEGPSYRNICFHRIWWQGRPAEHIWGGDYDKKDGSGGKSVLNSSDKEISSLPAGNRMPIQAGLVAGSFEMTSSVPSTIFRIYTKSDLKPRKDYSYSRDIEEVHDDSAFGKVVDGLDVLDRAIQRCLLVTEIMIVSCGIIIKL